MYNENSYRFLGRYCDTTAPGPIESPEGSSGVRILLHTDSEHVASGFKARYTFTEHKQSVTCGGSFTSQESGIITSRYYPESYKNQSKSANAAMSCNWYMTARPGYRLLINFEVFALEGDPVSKYHFVFLVLVEYSV